MDWIAVVALIASLVAIFGLGWRIGRLEKNIEEIRTLLRKRETKEDKGE